MKRILFTIFAGMFIFLASGIDLRAQATAQISGTVKDQSGAVLPGVEVTVTQTETAAARTAVTNETGSYVLSNLPIGPYRLEAGLPGFRTYIQTGIVLEVNGSPTINPVLEVGQITEQVEVQANAALVETRNVGVGAVVENARILELPLNGRNVIDLVGIIGAATPAPTVDGGQRDPFARGSVSVAGGMNSGLNYTLDGANHDNQFDNGYLSLPFPDALQEFKVQTGGSTAQTGVKSAGSVSLVTKSGTNEFHGNLFEFVRNAMFNARNAFATKRDTIKRNQFGGTVGGPIITNKLFFFAGYQGTRIRQDPTDNTSFVPTAAMLAGDWTAFASPACNAGRQITLRAPWVNNRIDPALYSRPAVNFSSKLPKTDDPCGKVIYGNPTLENDYMMIGRIDYQRSSSHSIFGRYLVESVFIPPAYDLNHNLLSAQGNASVGSDGLAQAFTIGDTYLFGSNVVNAVRLSANRMFGGKTRPKDIAQAQAGLPDVGVKMFSYDPHVPYFNVTGGWSNSVQAGPTKLATFAGTDDLSILKGNHQLAIGASAALWWVNSYSNSYAPGRMTFNGQTIGLGMADFFFGNASEFTMGTSTEQAKRSRYLGLYTADTWKITQKLTLNYGLRWEPYFPMLNLDGSSVHFDIDSFRKGIKSTHFTNAPPGLFFDGDPGFPNKTGAYNKWWNFSPRLGIAWDVSGDGRTSVRSSVGTFYDFPSTRYMTGLTNLPPWNFRYIRNNVSLADPWANEPGGDPFPLPGGFGRNISKDVAWPLYALEAAMDYNSPNMQVTQWNLSLQKQVGSDWLASATYIGNHTIHFWSTQPFNPAVFIPGGPCTLNGVTYNPCSSTANTDQRRRLALENSQYGQYYGGIVRIDTGGTSSYNGLLLSLQRRAARGVTVGANYTWSHCITDTQDEFGALNATSGYSNPDDRHFSRGNCTIAGTDRRQIFNLSAVAETPRFSNRTLRIVGSGWRLSPIFKLLSGGFLTITTNLDRALNAVGGQRVNQLMLNPYGDKSVSNYLNPAAFALPALGTFGNVGTGSIAGPGSFQFDTALSRTFQINEGQKIEFRAEAFNITNSVRFKDPTTNFNSNTFGQVLSAQDPRIMQFALKYFY
jgi:Carboxypeptidase regulatory-like domain